MRDILRLGNIGELAAREIEEGIVCRPQVGQKFRIPDRFLEKSPLDEQVEGSGPPPNQFVEPNGTETEEKGE